MATRTLINRSPAPLTNQLFVGSTSSDLTHPRGPLITRMSFHGACHLGFGTLRGSFMRMIDALWSYVASSEFCDWAEWRTTAFEDRNFSLGSGFASDAMSFDADDSTDASGWLFSRSVVAFADDCCCFLCWAMSCLGRTCEAAYSRSIFVDSLIRWLFFSEAQHFPQIDSQR